MCPCPCSTVPKSLKEQILEDHSQVLSTYIARTNFEASPISYESSSPLTAWQPLAIVSPWHVSGLAELACGECANTGDNRVLFLCNWTEELNLHSHDHLLYWQVKYCVIHHKNSSPGGPLQLPQVLQIFFHKEELTWCLHALPVENMNKITFDILFTNPLTPLLSSTSEQRI